MTFSIRKVLIMPRVGVLALWLLPLLATAQQRVYESPIPAWVVRPELKNLTPASRTVSEGYFLKLYDYQIHVEQQTTYIHIVREIVSESGVQNGAEVWANFLPSHQKLAFHELSIIRGDKRIDKLDISRFNVVAVEQDAASYLYNGSYSAFFLIDDVRRGDVITYSYSISGRNPVFEGKFFEDIYLQSTVPIAQLYTSVLVSPERSLQVKEYNGAKKPNISTEKSLQRLVWEGTLIEAATYEDYTPGWYRPFQYVQLSEFPNWATVGAWANRVNTLPPTISGEVAEKADELLQATNGDLKQFASAAIRFVQDEIRYTGVEVGEYSHRANLPEKVIGQRYGDCKDKSLLLVAILRRAGISANMLLVSTRLGDHVKTELPSPTAFNHAVVGFEIDEKFYWADPTMSHQGGDLDNRYRPYYGTALVLKAPESKLQPLLPVEDGKTICTEVYEVLTDEKGLGNLHVETIYSGHEADAIRSQLAYGSVSDTEKSYLDYYSKLYPEIESTDSLQITDDREKNVITVVEHYHIPAFLTKNEETQQHEVSFYASMIGDRLPSLTGKRKAPIAVNFPGDIEYQIKVVSPIGWNIGNEHYFLDRDGYVVGTTASVKSDTLILNYQFRYHQREIPAAKNSEFATDIKSIKSDHLSYGLTFNLNGQAAASGFNWYAFFLALVVLGLLAFVGFRLYQREMPPKVDPETDFVYEHIGGWLILPLIGFFITPLQVAVFLITSGYFLTATWNAYEGTSHDTVFKSLFAFELAGNVITIGLAVICIVFMLRKKALLPTLAIGFYAFNLILVIVDYLLFLWADLPTASTATGDMESVHEFIRTIIAAAIWIPYFIRSSRVKATFVKP